MRERLLSERLIISRTTNSNKTRTFRMIYGHVKRKIFSPKEACAICSQSRILARSFRASDTLDNPVVSS